jgi:Flp pilus assembly protein TadG
MTTRRSSGRRAAGQSLVEFAIVLPIFLLLLFGLIDIGRFVYSVNALSEAAREGTRFGSVGAWTQSCAGPREACVEAVTRARLAGVPGATATAICQRYVADSATPSPVARGSCRTNDVLTVRVDADFEVLTPVIGQLLHTRAISGSSQVTVNQ